MTWNRFVLLTLWAACACPAPAAFAAERNEGDPDSKTRRLLVLAPGGPLIVRLTMTIDGQPFRTPRASLASNSGEDAFVLSRRGLLLSADPDLRALLDADGDGILSADEIQAAPERLERSDANQNEWLERDDFPADEANGERNAATHQMLIDFEASGGVQEVYDVLRARYAGPDRRIHREAFSRSTNLGRDLDLDGNGVIDSSEIAALHRIRPHIDLELNFGRTAALATGLKLTSHNLRPGVIGDELSLTDAGLTVKLPEVSLCFVSSHAPLQSGDPETEARTFLKQLDADKNGYIEKKEAGEGLRELFERMDADGDGRLFPGEIRAHYTWQRAVARSQIRAAVAEAGPPLFAGLDVNGDNRLSLREMQKAARNLAVFDRNGDGKITPAEMPGTIAIAFIHGPGDYGGPSIDVSRREERSARLPAERPVGPTWFTRMDRNNDGDLSPAEFLGTHAQFAEFDADHDGLIDAVEARAAAYRGR
jgi:Ca2+-binding EF-hand superfamily protein